MNPILNKDHIPDYFVAQFPGGGQRGYATVKLLEWFEKKTGLPTHQLFPYVTTGSVGILIASALYLPHPTEPNAARMSARQLASLFPDIASRTPQPAKFANKNSREPFADAIRPFIGHGQLKDFLGTVFFSAHEIGGLSQSYVVHGKLVNPVTGEESYIGDPHKKILDIAFAGTSLPSLFPAYEDHIDLAFAENPSESMLEIRRLFPHDAQGAFVRVGNFRSQTEKSRDFLKASGYVRQAASFAINGAVSDHTYSQTMRFANTLFRRMVFNLEYEIGPDYLDPPAVKANIATASQFKKIESMSEKFISDNLEMMTYLAKALKISALKRMRDHPETAFNVLPQIQEFALDKIPALIPYNDSKSYAFKIAAERFGKALGQTVIHSLNGALHTAFEVAQSPAVKQATGSFKLKFDQRMAHVGAVLLPRTFVEKEGAPAALPPMTQSQELH